MPVECCCGNELEAGRGYRVRMSPCRCVEVGPLGRSGRRGGANLEWVTEGQREERRRLGLPEVTDIEVGASTRWV